MEGILIVNKPGGMTSHDVVDSVRRKFQMKRVGHAGTLDPLATGVLILLIGKATKLFEKFVKFDKGYNATFILGTATNSADIEGKILSQKPYAHITEDQVKNIFKKYVGEIQQMPPMVSAVKIKGKKLYELARKGIVIERKPRDVKIESLQLEEFDLPNVQFQLECSKGTYVRQLAEDIGNDLGCGACISRIERTSVGPFRLAEAINLEDIHERHIRDWKG